MKSTKNSNNEKPGLRKAPQCSHGVHHFVVSLASPNFLLRLAFVFVKVHYLTFPLPCSSKKIKNNNKFGSHTTFSRVYTQHSCFTQ